MEVINMTLLLSRSEGRVIPYMGLKGVCGPKEYDVFSHFGHKKAIDFVVWSQIGPDGF